MMNDFWQKLVQQAQQTTPPFDCTNNTYLMPLEQLAVIQVSGDDATNFLQNLLTNDVASLEINQSQYTGFCTPKGRLLAFFLLIRRQDSYQIVLPLDVAQSLQQRLTMYVLRSKVIITNQSDDIVCLGLNKPLPKPSKRVKQLTINMPRSQHCLLLVTADSLEPLCDELVEAGYQLASSTLWESLNIDAGIAKVTAETQEKFTPQQLNLDLNDGVSFKKGCYPGQEVVARLHYLGNPSRRMFSGEAKAEQLPAIGSEIKTADGAVAGHVVNAVHQDLSTVKILTTLKLSEHQKTLLLSDDNQLIINEELTKTS